MKLRRNLLMLGTGAALMYLFDPDRGHSRRVITRDRAAGKVRHGLKRGERIKRRVTADAYGMRQKLQHLQEEPKPQPDDITLVRKVETELFRDPDVPKGKISIDSAEGIVTLRGEIDDRSMIEQLEREAGKVQGVRGVRNFLHEPGVTAPNAPGT